MSFDYVTFIGGPADLRRQVLSAPCRTIEIPVCDDTAQFHDANAPVRLSYSVARYHVHRVARRHFIALHESLQ